MSRPTRIAGLQGRQPGVPPPAGGARACPDAIVGTGNGIGGGRLPRTGADPRQSSPVTIFNGRRRAATRLVSCTRTSRCPRRPLSLDRIESASVKGRWATGSIGDRLPKIAGGYGSMDGFPASRSTAAGATRGVAATTSHAAPECRARICSGTCPESNSATRTDCKRVDSSRSCRLRIGLTPRLCFVSVFEQLVEQIESRFAELERQMSDPEVIADRERYAEVGARVPRARSPRSAPGAASGGRSTTTSRAPASCSPRTGTTGAARGRRRGARRGSRSSPRRSAWRWSSATRTTTRTSSSRSAPGPAATRRRCSPATSTRCSPATPRSAASRPRCSPRSPAEVGGFKEVTFAIKGDGAYSVFKYEGGTHRVQRVPKTESQGRIHTSTATVAVLPGGRGGRGRRSTRTTSRSTSTAPRARAASRSTRPTRRSGSPTSRPGSSSRCRTRSRSSRTATRRCGCCARGCSSRRSPSSRRRSPPSARRRSAPASARRRSAPTTSPRAGSPTTGSSSPRHDLDGVLGGDLREFTDALAAEEKRRRLEAQAAGAG